MTSFTVQANGQLTDAAAYRPVIVAYRERLARSRLADIGEVVDGVENDKAAAWYNDERVDLPGDLQAARARTRSPSRAKSVRSFCPTFQKQLPAAATLHVLYDRSVSIRD